MARRGLAHVFVRAGNWPLMRGEEEAHETARRAFGEQHGKADSEAGDEPAATAREGVERLRGRHPLWTRRARRARRTCVCRRGARRPGRTRSRPGRGRARGPRCRRRAARCGAPRKSCSRRPWSRRRRRRSAAAECRRRSRRCRSSRASRATMPGTAQRVRRVSATMLTASMASIFSGAHVSKLPRSPRPALLIRMSGGKGARSSSLDELRDGGRVGEIGDVAGRCAGTLAESSPRRISRRSRRRATRMRCSTPRSASWRANSSPRPEDAPVTSADFPAKTWAMPYLITCT